MKNFPRLLLLLVSVGVLSPAFVFAEATEPKRSPEEIEKLVAPIALYPDSLVALILPASTESSDVVRAARFFSGGGQQDDVEKQFWSESVKSLAHYPEIVRWMDENLEWTQQMGEAFVAQPADVMSGIQRLRVHARATGLLTDTPQQRVVVEQEVVYIQPAEPRYIYIPRYDPEILWMRRSYRGSFISFGVGFSVGNWLYYDCDWPGRTIYVHRRHPNWAYHPGWRPPAPSVRVNVVQEWHPAPRHAYRHSSHSTHRPPAVVAVPHSPGTMSQVLPVSPVRPVSSHYVPNGEPQRVYPTRPENHGRDRRDGTSMRDGPRHEPPSAPAASPQIAPGPAVRGPVPSQHLDNTFQGRSNHGPRSSGGPSQPRSAPPAPAAPSAPAVQPQPAPQPAPASAAPRSFAPGRTAPASAPELKPSATANAETANQGENGRQGHGRRGN